MSVRVASDSEFGSRLVYERIRYREEIYLPFDFAVRGFDTPGVALFQVRVEGAELSVCRVWLGDKAGWKFQTSKNPFETSGGFLCFSGCLKSDLF